MSTVCVSDDDLVARARQGDPAAFGELVDRHRSAVYRAALAALGSHAEAEDAAQEAFLLAYRRLTGFRGDASFKTWLLTIAWHQAINRRRSMTRLLRQIVQPARDQGSGIDARTARGRRAVPGRCGRAAASCIARSARRFDRSSEAARRAAAGAVRRLQLRRDRGDARRAGRHDQVARIGGATDW